MRRDKFLSDDLVGGLIVDYPSVSEVLQNKSSAWVIWPWFMNMAAYTPFACELSAVFLKTYPVQANTDKSKGLELRKARSRHSSQVNVFALEVSDLWFPAITLVIL
jgi:hypothetical protein